MSVKNGSSLASQPSVKSSATRRTTISIKLLWQLVYLFSMFIPCILWSVVKPLFTKKKSLVDQIALVTGAGGGIGRELCIQLAEEGCRIACADINNEATKETARIVKEKYPRADVFWYHCDVSSTEDIQRLRTSILKDMGPVKLLINNAGILRGGRVQKVKDEELSRMLDVNLKSHFLMVREFMPDMLRNGGHIVAIASLLAVIGAPFSSEYAAAKHGVFGFMESLRYELRTVPGNKVKTTCICPYFIRTDAVRKIVHVKSVIQLPVKESVKEMVDAIRKNKTVAFIPSWAHTCYLLIKILPECYFNMIMDFLESQRAAKSDLM